MIAPLIRELPPDERPRERLLDHGGEALSDREVIAVLLRTGGPEGSALQLAADLLREHGGVLGLLDLRPDELERPGLGPAKAASLMAATELGRRLARYELPERMDVENPRDTARYLHLKYADRHQEVMGALYVDARHRLAAERVLFRGTLDRAAVEPRPVLREALLCSASGILLFHTHPSGDPSPSLEDLEFTRRLVAACETMGVTLLDHLVVARGGRWTSLQQRLAW